MVASGWIEQVFHMSPDGGSGLTENLITVAVLLSAVGLGVRRMLRRMVSRKSR